ncbi:MAG: hypothetical protein LUI06_09975 [Ruminococcus sp.]|nr:hypothetical protein [Ruminococcus sp.]
MAELEKHVLDGSDLEAAERARKLLKELEREEQEKKQKKQKGNYEHGCVTSADIRYTSAEEEKQEKRTDD